MIPSWMPFTTAVTRLLTPSFLIVLERWNSTVFSEIEMISPISQLVFPSLHHFKHSVSFEVRELATPSGSPCNSRSLNRYCTVKACRSGSLSGAIRRSSRRLKLIRSTSEPGPCSGMVRPECTPRSRQSSRNVLCLSLSEERAQTSDQRKGRRAECTYCTRRECSCGCSLPESDSRVLRSTAGSWPLRIRRSDIPRLQSPSNTGLPARPQTWLAKTLQRIRQDMQPCGIPNRYSGDGHPTWSKNFLMYALNMRGFCQCGA